MNVFLINVPSRRGKGAFTLPIGLLYVASIIERNGHKAKIYDPYLNDVACSDFDSDNFTGIEKEIEAFKPEIIGFSGISTSYGRTKKLSYHIKTNYPEIYQIAGGVLSSVNELLLSNTKISVIFHSETEISLPIFLDKFAENKPFYNMGGVSFIYDGKIVRNNNYKQIKDLDQIPIPNYDFVDVLKYTQNIDGWLQHYNILQDYSNDIIANLRKKGYYIPIVTSRGCTHKCLFCYRHMRGIRQHSVDYVINHISLLISKYNIRGFQFADELFNANPKWVLEFCDRIEKENMDIYYLIAGARISNINRLILSRLKETGCIEINYGHESGSDKILRELSKGIDSKANKEGTLLTKEIGIHCPIQLVIGSPSENTQTISETINFINETEERNLSINYLIPLPETPIWKYVEDHKLIDNLEKYLDLVAEKGGYYPLVNLTKVSDNIWGKWRFIIQLENRIHFYKKNKEIRRYILFKILLVITKFIPSSLLYLSLYLRDKLYEKANNLKLRRLFRA